MKIALENQKIINKFLEEFSMNTKQHFRSFSHKVNESDLR
jgi:hypothetical protein